MLIAIWRPPAIGDGLLLAPSLRALRRYDPSAHIHLWAEPSAAELLLSLRLVDSIGDTSKGFRLGSMRPDVFISFDWQFVEIGRTADVFEIPRITSVSATGEGQGLHQGRYFFETFARTLGLPESLYDEDAVTRLPYAFEERSWRETIVLYPSASSIEKRWPIDRYVALAKRLSDRGYRVIYLEPPNDNYGEPEYGEVVSRQLLGMAAILGEAALFIGNDTGPTHLAALLGCPTIALFGPSPPSHWRPLGKHVTVLQRCERRRTLDSGHWCRNHRDCFAALSPALVERVARYRLAQRPLVVR